MRARLAAALLLAAGGCATDPAAAPVPALRSAADATDQAMLEAAAARLAGASSVDLAASAFVEEAELLVEPRPLRTLEGVADGRTLAPPVRLRLEQDSQGCRLLDVASGATVRLPGLDCVPAP